MAPKHAVVLCADDLGLTDGVSRGILELAGRGRLSATSAMTNRPLWRRFARDMGPLRPTVALGLHLNLTLGAPLGAMPGLAPAGTFPKLEDLVIRSFTGRIPPDELRAEIGRQLQAFEDATGTAPDFIDGHQHVHVLPVIRGALIGLLAERPGPARPWLRDPSDRVLAIMRRDVGARKALFVKALALGFWREAQAAGLDVNDGFSGFGPFDPGVPAERVLARAFLNLGPRPVVMCHPGHVDEELRGLDPAVESRAQELSYLASDAFADLLAERDAKLVARLP